MSQSLSAVPFTSLHSHCAALISMQYLLCTDGSGSLGQDFFLSFCYTPCGVPSPCFDSWLYQRLVLFFFYHTVLSRSLETVLSLLETITDDCQLGALHTALFVKSSDQRRSVLQLAQNKQAENSFRKAVQFHT